MIEVLIETVRGARNKLKLDQGRLKLAKVLPRGMVFPFDFGSVLGTVADDGDPLDALVLLDEPTAAGCLVEARLLGVIEAKQGRKRNDVLLAVAAEDEGAYRSLADVPQRVLDEIEHFFASYHALGDEQWHAIARRGAKEAAALVKRARTR